MECFAQIGGGGNRLFWRSIYPKSAQTRSSFSRSGKSRGKKTTAQNLDGQKGQANSSGKQRENDRENEPVDLDFIDYDSHYKPRRVLRPLINCSMILPKLPKNLNLNY